MTASPAQPASVREGAHLMLYDEAGGLGSRLLQFFVKHDRRAVSEFRGRLIERTGRTE